MSDPIGPGDWVECVDASPRGWPAPPAVRRGAIYQVEAVDDHPISGPGVWLVGIRSRAWTGGYHADRFRPIYRRRDGESLTAKLLEGALSGVPAKVVRERSRETIKSGASQ